MANYIRRTLKKSDFFVSLYRSFLIREHKYICKTDREKSVNIHFRKKFKRDVNLQNPKNLIEKIYWMAFNTDTSLWTECADKYAVRNYVEKCGWGHILNKLYGYYYDVDEVDFDTLPHEFVLKSNNACGTVLLVRDKDNLDIKKTKRILRRWLKYEFGYFAAQFHYLKIKPCIIVEEFLHDSIDHKNSLIDYKFTCFNGIPESVMVVSERKIEGDHSYLLNLYDMDWNPINDKVIAHKNERQVQRPQSFDVMVQACMKLGKDIPYVRIDFYEIDGKPVFGEMTFTTAYDYFTDEYYDYLGSKIDLNRIMRAKK